MDSISSLAISASGMDQARLRLEVAALNLAQSQTVAPPGAQPWQPLSVVATAAASFDAALRGEAARVELLPRPASARRMHEPGHPLADAQGFVQRPGVDAALEMTQVLAATRAYEANLAAFQAARLLALRTLDIGGPA